jgi:hypothetical protein
MRTGDEWLCDIKYQGLCKRLAVTAWICPVEGVEIAACTPCVQTWRAAASVNTYLATHCPRCAKTGQPATTVPAPQHSDRPLTGIVARALESAMLAEGVLIDVRTRVLKRLAVEAEWLGGWGETSGAAAEPTNPVPGREAAEDSVGSPEAVGMSGSLLPTAQTSGRF